MLQIWTAPSPKHKTSILPSEEKSRWDSFLVNEVWFEAGLVPSKTTLTVLGNLERYAWLILDVCGVNGRTER